MNEFTAREMIENNSLLVNKLKELIDAVGCDAGLRYAQDIIRAVINSVDTNYSTSDKHDDAINRLASVIGQIKSARKIVAQLECNNHYKLEMFYGRNSEKNKPIFIKTGLSKSSDSANDDEFLKTLVNLGQLEANAVNNVVRIISISENTYNKHMNEK